MAKRSYVIRKKSFLWSLLLYAFLMQDAITEIVPVFRYVDEIAAIAFFVYFVLELRHGKINKIDMHIAVVCLIMCVFGFLGNYFSGVSLSLKDQVYDAFNIFKYVMALWGAQKFFNEYSTKRYLIHYLAQMVKITVLISTVFMLQNLFVDIDMHTDYRYGIRTFNFVFSRVGEMYQACILWLVILTAERFYNNQTKLDIYFLLIIINMISTIRSRAFAYAVLFVFIYFYLIVEKSKRLTVWHYLSIALFILPIGADQLEYYIGDSSKARSVLLQYGVVTASNYFPFGAGFATYGTAVARDIYSLLYEEYGFRSIWGLSPGGSFLTDNYWPAILGEFGYLGAALNVVLVLLVFRKLRRNTDNPYSKACIYFGMGTLIIDSTISSSFLACTQSMIFLCLICKLDYLQLDSAEK